MSTEQDDNENLQDSRQHVPTLRRRRGRENLAREYRNSSPVPTSTDEASTAHDVSDSDSYVTAEEEPLTDSDVDDSDGSIGDMSIPALVSRMSQIMAARGLTNENADTEHAREGLPSRRSSASMSAMSAESDGWYILNADDIFQDDVEPAGLQDRDDYDEDATAYESVESRSSETIRSKRHRRARGERAAEKEQANAVLDDLGPSFEPTIKGERFDKGEDGEGEC